MMPKIPQGRGFHGCGTTAIKKQRHLVVFGGYNLATLDSIYLFNFATQQWLKAPAAMAMPAPIYRITAAKIIQMDEDVHQQDFTSAVEDTTGKSSALDKLMNSKNLLLLVPMISCLVVFSSKNKYIKML